MEPPAVKKPPVGVPADATYFNGKWYRLYTEKVSWKSERQRCDRLGGQLAIIPDEPTQKFLKKLGRDLSLWIGGIESKLEGAWQWVDGSDVTFKRWARGQPNNAFRGQEQYMVFAAGGAWHDAEENAPWVVGYICEWKQK